MTQQPSVGRMVHYRSYGTPGGEYAPQCRAAIIAEVGAWMRRPSLDSGEGIDEAGVRFRVIGQQWEPDACALVVKNPTGEFFLTCSYDEAGEQGGTWHWPERV